MQRARKLLVRELPLAAGVAFGLTWLWLKGEAFVLDNRVEGYGWGAYLANAWAMAKGEVGRYDYFHGPLHGALVGPLGELMGSYPAASALVASSMALLVVVGAGLGARALAGAWAGGLAAAVAPMTANAADMARWSNPYPVLAGLTGITLGLALCTARWPTKKLALLTGIGAALCTVADSRGLLLMPVAAVLVLSGATARKRGWMLIPMFCLGLVARPAFRHAIDWSDERAAEKVDRIVTQRRVVQRWVISSRDAALQTACSRLSTDDYLTRAHITGPCAPALLRHNIEVRLPPHLPLGGPLTLVGALLVLLPGGRGRRGFVEGAVTLLGLGGGFAALFMLTPMVDRYLVHVAAIVTLLPAAGMGRLARSLPQRWLRPLVASVMAVAVLAWTLRTDPPNRTATTALQNNVEKQAESVVNEELYSRLERIDTFLDCSDMDASIPLLPWLPHAPASFMRWPLDRLTYTPQCVEWINRPPTADGVVYVGVNTKKRFPLQRGGSERLLLSAVVAEQGSWEKVWSHRQFELWRIPEPTQAAPE
jgi:hypothetical protein